MEFHMKMVFLMLVALCTTAIPAGHARLLVKSNIGESSQMVKSMLLGGKASPEEFSDSVPISGAGDVLSVSSVPRESLGDVSVSSVPKAISIAPKASPAIISPKASPARFSASVATLSAEDVLSVSSVPIQCPEPQHIFSEEPSPGHVSIASEAPSTGHASIDSVPHTVSEPAPWTPSTVSEPAPGHVSIASEEPSSGHVSIDSVPHTVSEPDPWPPSLILS